MVVSFLRQLVDEPVFHLLPCPGGFAQEREAGLHRRIELETTDGDAPPHLAPAIPLDKLIENVFQRYTMQRIAGMGSRRCHDLVIGTNWFVQAAG